MQLIEKDGDFLFGLVGKVDCVQMDGFEFAERNIGRGESVEEGEEAA